MWEGYWVINKATKGKSKENYEKAEEFGQYQMLEKKSRFYRKRCQIN